MGRPNTSQRGEVTPDAASTGELRHHQNRRNDQKLVASTPRLKEKSDVSVSGSRSRMLPANMFGAMTSNRVPEKIRSPWRRSSGSAEDQSVSPCVRNDTSTAAFRLSSPWMNLSKPRLIRSAARSRNHPSLPRSAGRLPLAPTRPCRDRSVTCRSRTRSTLRCVRVERFSHARSTSLAAAWRLQRGIARGLVRPANVDPSTRSGTSAF